MTQGHPVTNYGPALHRRAIAILATAQRHLCRPHT